MLVIRRDPNPYYRYSNTLLSASVIRKIVKTLNRFFSETGTHKLSKYKCVLYVNIDIHPGRPTTPRTSPTTPGQNPYQFDLEFLIVKSLQMLIVKSIKLYFAKIRPKHANMSGPNVLRNLILIDEARRTKFMSSRMT